MGRPPSDLDDYLDWQERLGSFRASGMSVDEFCLQEGVSRATYYRWVGQLKDGIPKEMVAEKAAREKAESGEAAFVPITLKASPVEIELPNGGVVRLPLWDTFFDAAVGAPNSRRMGRRGPEWPNQAGKRVIKGRFDGTPTWATSSSYLTPCESLVYRIGDAGRCWGIRSASPMS